MPVMDGWSVCKAIRAESQTPIIMLTAKGETNDKVSGLKSGADDYITKPFEMKEVLARIEAVLRRSTGAAVEKKERKLTFDNLVIDMDAFVLTVKGQKIYTPPKEMELLYYLASSPNRVYTRQPASRRSLGLRLFRRFPDRGRTHQASAGKIGGCQRSVVPENRLGRGV